MEESQKHIFLQSEGDKYFERNLQLYTHNLSYKADLAALIKSLELNPTNVLEIGCANGSVLSAIYDAFQCNCFGIDPSAAAIEDGKQRFPGLNLQVGTADQLDFDDDYFDLIIFGFSLYLCDRKDLFKIAYEADRCLRNQGSLIIKDFYPPFPFRNNYAPRPGMFSYKMDYSNMFLWNPAYREIYLNVFSHAGNLNRDIPDEKVAIKVLRKVAEQAYPTQPFSPYVE